MESEWGEALSPFLTPGSLSLFLQLSPFSVFGLSLFLSLYLFLKNSSLSSFHGLPKKINIFRGFVLVMHKSITGTNSHHSVGRSH